MLQLFCCFLQFNFIFDILLSEEQNISKCLIVASTHHIPDKSFAVVQQKVCCGSIREDVMQLRVVFSLWLSTARNGRYGRPQSNDLSHYVHAWHITAVVCRAQRNGVSENAT